MRPLVLAAALLALAGCSSSSGEMSKADKENFKGQGAGDIAQQKAGMAQAMKEWNEKHPPGNPSGP